MLDKIDEMFAGLLADLDELMEARSVGEYFRILGRQFGRDFRRLFRGA